MHSITSAALLAAFAYLTLAAPAAPVHKDDIKEWGPSKFIGDPFKNTSHPDIVAAHPDLATVIANLKDYIIKDISENLIPSWEHKHVPVAFKNGTDTNFTTLIGNIREDIIKDISDNVKFPLTNDDDDTAKTTKKLEARGSIFDFCFSGLPPLNLENSIDMDQYWNLAVAGGGIGGNWVAAPGNDGDLEYNAYTDRDGGIAYAHFNFRINALAYFPSGQTVRWTVTENRSGTTTCVASGLISATDRSNTASWALDSTASYSLTIQDAHE